MLDLSFYKGKTVLVTGHTGFKGSWLCKILIGAGAKVIGYSNGIPTVPSLFEMSKVEDNMVSIIGDVCDFKKLKTVFDEYKPEIVMHLAAQPIVRESYVNPRGTYETNVMGTVNILECVRLCDSVKSVLNVTTDKVYYNADESNHAFKEDEPLDGYDPYSNSKSCSELVTHSYKKSFFDTDFKCRVSTARAGNVIGGGDFAKDRIIPDCVRAVENGKKIQIRNPYSTRPYQHVLEPLFMYLTICQAQYEDAKYAGYYNVGPDDEDCVSTGELVTLFCNKWGDISWESQSNEGPHEANFLKLSNNKIKQVFGWKPTWHIDQAIEKTIEWTKVYLDNKANIPQEMDREIKQYLEK